MTPPPRSAIEAIALPVAGVAGLLAVWQFVAPAAGAPAYILPTPTQIAAVFREDWPLLWSNLAPTALEALGGFVLGNGAAVLTAVAFVYSRAMRLTFFPLALFLNTIPVLALAPIITLVFGIGMASKVVIAAVICFFPTLINMIRGLNSPTRNELDLMHVLSATGWDVFWRLRLPRAAPLLFSSLRIASASAVIGAIVGEWIGADRGLGALIIQSTFNYRSAELYAAIILSSTLAIGLFGLVVLVERAVIRYRETDR